MLFICQLLEGYKLLRLKRESKIESFFGETHWNAVGFPLLNEGKGQLFLTISIQCLKFV